MTRLAQDRVVSSSSESHLSWLEPERASDTITLTPSPDSLGTLMNTALAVAQANGDPGGFTDDIHAALPRIKSKRGDGPVAMVMTGPDGTVRTF